MTDPGGESGSLDAPAGWGTAPVPPDQERRVRRAIRWGFSVAPADRDAAVRIRESGQANPQWPRVFALVGGTLNVFNMIMDFSDAHRLPAAVVWPCLAVLVAVGLLAFTQWFRGRSAQKIGRR